MASAGMGGTRAKAGGGSRSGRPSAAAALFLVQRALSLVAAARDRDGLAGGITRLLAGGPFEESVGFVFLEPGGQVARPHPSYHCPSLGPAGLAGRELSARALAGPKAEGDEGSRPAVVLPGAVCRVAAPVRVAGRVVGFLCAESLSPGRFGPDEAALLGAVARAAGVGLERLELRLQGRRLQREMAARVSLGRAIARSLKLDELLSALHREVARLLAPDAFVVALYDEGEDRIDIRYIVEEGKRLPPVCLPLSETPLAAWVLRERRQVLIRNMDAEAPLLPVQPRHFTRPAQSWLGVPLVARERRIGVLSVQSFQAYAFDEEDLSLFAAMADQIALALDNARLYEAEESERRLASTLLETVQIVGSTLRLDEVLERILRQLRRVVPYTSASVQLRRGEDLEIVACQGFPRPEEILGLRFSVHGNNPNRQVVETLRPVRYADIRQFFPVFEEPRHSHIRSWLGVPLLYKGELIGMITLDRSEVNAFSRQDEEIAMAFASQVAVAIENAALYEEAERRAITDGLTGLYNNRYFYDRLEQELDQGRRYGQPVALIMLDIDNFKQFNDRWGHLAGDDLLKGLAEWLRRHVRAGDAVARYGGEEFAVILPRTDLPSAARLAERLLAAVRAFRLGTATAEGGAGAPPSISVSAGVAAFPDHAVTAGDLVHAADMALLAAKRAGKDRVCVAGGQGPAPGSGRGAG